MFNHHYKKQLFTFHICNYLVGLFRTKACSYPVDRDVKLNRLYEIELQKHRKRHETMKRLENLPPLVPQLGDLICMQIFTLFSRWYSCLFPLYTIDTPLTLRPSCQKYQAERKKILCQLLRVLKVSLGNICFWINYLPFSALDIFMHLILNRNLPLWMLLAANSLLPSSSLPRITYCLVCLEYIKHSEMPWTQESIRCC